MLTVGDLLTHYPRRYARRGELTALSELVVGESVTIVAEVIEVVERSMRERKGTILEVRITDGKGILVLTFFNQAWRKNELTPGARGIFAGKVGEYRGIRQLAHPDYDLFEAGDDARQRPRGEEVGDAAHPDLPGHRRRSRAGRSRKRSASCSTRCRPSTTPCRSRCAPSASCSTSGRRTS